jgi:exonuclease SbcC
MSYAEATLDLSSIPVVCLTGLNGAGKSALLDALTWAIWETGRSSSDELIRLGEKEMWVDLIFLHEGERYRVRRSRQKLSVKAGARVTSKGTLEFQVFNANKQNTLEAIAVGGRAASTDRESLAVDTGLTGKELSTSGIAPSRPSGPSRPSQSTVPQPNEPQRSDGKWRSLTGASVRQTQKQITDLLRMDFDTFVNSAYLRQGKADEFTTRPPSERKQILSDILGLAYFDKLQEKARERARQLKTEVELLSRDLANLPAMLTSLKEKSESIETHTSLLFESEKQLTQLEEEVEKVAVLLAESKLASERLKLGEEHAESLREDIQKLQVQRDQHINDLQNLEQLISRSLEVVEAGERFDTIKDQVELFDKNAFEVQELTTQKMSLQHSLATMRARLEVELSSVSSKSAELEERMKRVTHDAVEKDKLTQAYAEYRRSIADEADMASRQETFARMTNRASELVAQITESKIRLEADLFQKEQALKELEIVLHSQQSLEAQKLELEEESKELDKFETEFQLIEENGIKIKSNIEAKVHKIESLKSQQKDRANRIEELHVHSDSSTCPLCSGHIIDRAAVLDKYSNEISTIEYEITSETAAMETLEQDRTELRKRYTELRSALQKRPFLDKQIGQFNEKMMAIERSRSSIEKIEKDVETLQSRLQNDNYAQLERESLIGIKAELHKLEFDPVAYANLQSQIRTQRHVEVRYQQMQRDLQELKKIDETLPELQEQVKKLQDELGSESYGIEERKSLSELQQMLSKFNYDRTLHSQLKEQLTELLPLAELRRELQVAQQDLPKLKEFLQNVEKQKGAKEDQLRTIAAERESLASRSNDLPVLQALGEKLKPDLQAAREPKEDLAKKAAVLEAEHQNLKNELSVLEQSQIELKELNSTLDDHNFLAEAFGKKGIQAVIIENAIPEIETEANRILSRLTENKMHIAFITQQKNKTGGTMETLDLVIGDEIGTRNYELFSGGEAFKVNFAVRVALSRLLARRSGAKLETLIVDEGFGSQDEASRERLVKAIQAIQNEFARIIVITHMGDIKEMFTAQINVSKIQGASQLQIMY